MAYNSALIEYWEPGIYVEHALQAQPSAPHDAVEMLRFWPQWLPSNYIQFGQNLSEMATHMHGLPDEYDVGAEAVLSGLHAAYALVRSARIPGKVQFGTDFVFSRRDHGDQMDDLIDTSEELLATRPAIREAVTVCTDYLASLGKPERFTRLGLYIGLRLVDYGEVRKMQSAAANLITRKARNIVFHAQEEMISSGEIQQFPTSE